MSDSLSEDYVKAHFDFTVKILKLTIQAFECLQDDAEI